MKSFQFASRALALGALAFAAGPALADHGPDHGFGGMFLGQSLVTAASANCTTTVGETFTSVLQAGSNNTQHDNNHVNSSDWHHGPQGPAIVIRESLNTPTNLGIIIAEFPPFPAKNGGSGNYKYGLEGGTLQTGTFQVTVTPLSPDSFTVVSTLTYIPLGGTETCTETDQTTYIRTGFGQ